MKSQFNQIQNKYAPKPIQVLQEEDFKSPKRLANAMDLVFPGHKTFRNKWVFDYDTIESWENLAIVERYKEAFNVRDFNQQTDARDLKNVAFREFYNTEDVYVVEVNYNWFYKRNLMKELNWFQIWVGKLVRIL